MFDVNQTMDFTPCIPWKGSPDDLLDTARQGLTQCRAFVEGGPLQMAIAIQLGIERGL
jgi:hypothetical protein